MLKYLFLFLLSAQASAQTIYLPNIKATLTGSVFGDHKSADVNVVNTVPIPVEVTSVTQGPKGTIPESWYVQPCDGTNCQSFLPTGEGLVALTAPLPAGSNTIGGVTQSGTWDTGRTWNLSDSTDSVSATQNGAWSVGRTWNLDSADDSVTVTGTVGVTGSVGVTGTVDANVISSVLPTGAATSANQTTANASLSSIDGKLGSLGQKTMSGSAPVVIASDQSPIPTSFPINSAGNSPGSSTVSTVTSLAAPANAVGFILMNLDTSTANVRWRIGATATTSSGQQLQPGRDTGFVPCSAAVSLVAESGTQNYDIQWVLSQ